MIKGSKSDIEWRAYGDLGYGASDDLSAGLKEWSLLKGHLQQYGLADTRTCAELGCGAGRLTAALARDFAVVQALDISADRITQARKTVNSDRVEFHLLREPVMPISDGTCDLCISTHVLQHIADVRVIEAYLREMRRVLRPGGCLLIHVPVVGAHGMTGDLGEVILWRSREIVKAIVLLLTRQLMRVGFHRLPWKVDRYRVFSFVRLEQLLRRLGFEGIELRVLPWAGGHGYVFAKISANSNLRVVSAVSALG